MQTPSTISAAYLPRLTELSSRLNRKPIVRRMAMSSGIEYHAKDWALAHESWNRHFGNPVKDNK